MIQNDRSFLFYIELCLGLCEKERFSLIKDMNEWRAEELFITSREKLKTRRDEPVEAKD